MPAAKQAFEALSAPGHYNFQIVHADKMLWRCHASLRNVREIGAGELGSTLRGNPNAKLLSGRATNGETMSIDTKKCFVLSLEGTVFTGETPVRGTIFFIREFWKKTDFYFLNNDTSKDSAACLEKLNYFGIPADETHLLSPTLSLVDYLQSADISVAYLVGTKDYYSELKTRLPGLELTNPAGDHMDHLLDNLLFSEKTVAESQAVIVAFDTELAYQKLVVAVQLLQQPDVAFLAISGPATSPSQSGPLPDTGSLLALLQAATARKPDRLFGSPMQEMLYPALDRFPKSAIAVVSDNLSRDKALADNAGIDFILVLSGETTMKQAHDEQVQPWKIAKDMGEFI